MTPDEDQQSVTERAIRRRIADAGAISFAEFMGLALYHPQDGYYVRADAVTGPEGDFSTSPDVSPAFGRRLAVQLADVWTRLGGGPWRVVELGPGRGLLAADLVAGLQRCAPTALEQLAELVLVEISPSFAEQQRRCVAQTGLSVPVRWVRGLHQLSASSIDGVILGNEFLDALPVHLVARRSTGLVERCVALAADGSLCFVDRPLSDPRLAERVDRYGLCRRDDDQSEVCLELESTLAQIARVLTRGAAIFIDYGHPAARLADEDHAAGTLLAYHRHQVVLDLLDRPGRQDLTAHVNWDHLQDAAREHGLTWAGRVTQDKFLLALGLIDDLVPALDSAEETAQAMARRLAARSLILPGAGGGKRFEAVLLVKGIPADLRGLSDPFAALP